jgi:esterase/lipase superfamily enzyme
MLIDPTEWFQNEEIRLNEVSQLEQEVFVDQLRSLVQASSHRALLVVVHGFRERFPSALRKTAFLGHVLDINAPVLVFDWPGNQGSSLRGYRRAHEIARASGAELARTLELIIREVQPERLWLVANSMGGQVVADAFSLLYQQADLGDSQTEFEDVVLTAPDVDQEEFASSSNKRSLPWPVISPSMFHPTIARCWSAGSSTGERGEAKVPSARSSWRRRPSWRSWTRTAIVFRWWM